MNKIITDFLKTTIRLINQSWFIFRSYCDPAFEGSPYFERLKPVNNKKNGFNYWQKRLGWKTN